MKERDNVTSTVLELVELPNGDIALKRADSDDKPLVHIRFSEESEMAMDEVKMHVARAMVEAGIEAFAELNIPAAQEDETPPVIH
ncbi:MAG TPA: hypothetical protein VIN71_05350 [Pseudomonadales bacterium]